MLKVVSAEIKQLMFERNNEIQDTIDKIKLSLYHLGIFNMHEIDDHETPFLLQNFCNDNIDHLNDIVKDTNQIKFEKLDLSKPLSTDYLNSSRSNLSILKRLKETRVSELANLILAIYEIKKVLFSDLNDLKRSDFIIKESTHDFNNDFESLFKFLSSFFVQISDHHSNSDSLQTLFVSIINKSLVAIHSTDRFLDNVDQTNLINPVLSTSLSPKFIEQMRKLKDFLLEESIYRIERIKNVCNEIEVFWSQLEYPLEKRIVLKNDDISMYQEYKDYADQLRGEWMVKMKETVDLLLSELKILWEKCFVPKQTQQSFISSLADIYSPINIPTLQSQITIYKAKLKQYAEVYAKISKRKSYIEKIVNFEKTASDPSRLRGSSIRLLEEEKFRRTCFPTLLDMEALLKRACLQLENEIGGPFVYLEERYLDTMEKEIEGRYFDPNVFVLDGGGASQINTKLAKRRSRSLSRSSYSNLKKSE